MTYDALGRMVEQSNSGTNTEIQYAPTGFKMQTFNGQTVVDSFVPLPGGTVLVPQCTCYFHGDWMGSSRFASRYNDRTMFNDLAYAPFGEQYAKAGNTVVGNESFAGNNEGTTTNLYDAQFREYEIYGRWPSPDPAGMAAANPANPQSWNRYAYALNNPLLLVDPLGLDNCVWDDGSQDDPPGDGGDTEYQCLEAEGTWVQNTTVTVNGDDGSPFPPIPSPAPFIPTLPTSGGPGMGPPAQPPQPPQTTGCSASALWNGAKAAAADLVGTPPQYNSASPGSAVGDFLASKPAQAAAVGALYKVGAAVKGVSVVTDAAADFVPVLGWAWGGYQAVHAVYKGVQAYKESASQCSGGN